MALYIPKEKTEMNKQPQSPGALAPLHHKADNTLSATRIIRTFIADDSPFMLVLLARVLARDKRITVVGSSTHGPGAFYYACLSNPDLVLMDLHLPGSDAAEITRWLKQLRKPPVVFVVTSDDSPPARRRCLAAGADAFLVKSGELAVQLRKAVQKYFSDDFPEPKISTAIS